MKILTVRTADNGWILEYAGDELEIMLKVYSWDDLEGLVKDVKDLMNNITGLR